MGTIDNNIWSRIQQGFNDAERLIGQQDYNMALVKARQTLEVMVKCLGDKALIVEGDLSDNIDQLFEGRWISQATKDHYHRIRVLGNKAVHDGDDSSYDANEAFQLLSQEVQAFANTYSGGRRTANVTRPAQFQGDNGGEMPGPGSGNITRIPQQGSNSAPQSRGLQYGGTSGQGMRNPQAGAAAGPQNIRGPQIGSAAGQQNRGPQIGSGSGQGMRGTPAGSTGGQPGMRGAQAGSAAGHQGMRGAQAGPAVGHQGMRGTQVGSAAGQRGTRSPQAGSGAGQQGVRGGQAGGRVSQGTRGPQGGRTSSQGTRTSQAGARTPQAGNRSPQGSRNSQAGARNGQRPASRPGSGSNHSRRRTNKRGFDPYDLIKPGLIVVLIILIALLVRFAFSGKKEETETSEPTIVSQEVTTEPTVPTEVPTTTPPTEVPKIYKTTSRLNVRVEPSTEGSRLGTLAEGTVVEFVRVHDDQWSIIMFEGQQAYVSSQFLAAEDAPESITQTSSAP